jgi:hypothetical protein
MVKPFYEIDDKKIKNIEKKLNDLLHKYGLVSSFMTGHHNGWRIMVYDEITDEPVIRFSVRGINQPNLPEGALHIYKVVSYVDEYEETVDFSAHSISELYNFIKDCIKNIKISDYILN